MRYVLITIGLVLWTFITAFLHYTLPQRDIVFVQGTEILRADLSGWNSMFYAQADSGNETAVNRDLRLINATRSNGKVIVYRNEDTGFFGWPPYFKINSSDLQAEAQSAVSAKANPEWYLATHYGWRNLFLTTYPNLVSLEPHPGPDAPKPWPWANIIILVLLALIVLFIWRLWRRFRMRRIDPVMEELTDTWEMAGDAVDKKRNRLRRWIDTWRKVH